MINIPVGGYVQIEVKKTEKREVILSKGNYWDQSVL